MPSGVAMSVTVTQRGCGAEISSGRDDSGVDHRSRWRRSRGSAAPTTVRAETFGRSTESMLVATATDRSEQMAAEPSIPLVQNVFAISRTRASTTAIRAHLNRKILGPRGFGRYVKTAKISSAWENEKL